HGLPLAVQQGHVGDGLSGREHGRCAETSRGRAGGVGGYPMALHPGARPSNSPRSEPGRRAGAGRFGDGPRPDTRKSPGSAQMKIKEFIQTHFRHFNAATLKDAAEAYRAHIESGGKMMITLAGAMSTAELGISLAEMIRQDKVHAITCTGANLEEDVFNLVAHDHYVRIPNWRDLTPQ